MEDYMQQLIAEQQALAREEAKDDIEGPKRWTDCTYDERHDYIEALRNIYKQSGLVEATIDIHRQIGLNLAKGGQISSEEEFLFSENLFSVTKEENLERFNFDFRQLQKKFGEKYDESTAVVINESGYKVGDLFPEIRGLMHIKNETELQVFKESRSNILVALWSN